jgi:hypothetical protein
MAEYIRRGCPSPEKFAEEVAAENRAQKDRSKRLGTGSTIATALVKQVRRQKKLILANEHYRFDVAQAAGILPPDAAEAPPDIFK